MNDEIKIISIFTESTEDIGILYNSYKEVVGTVEKFLTNVEKCIRYIKEDPKKYKIDLKDDIRDFKEKIDKTFTPTHIDVNNINMSRKKILECRDRLNDILEKYSKLKNDVSFGGNYVRAILKRPKVYSKETDFDSYSIINNNIRNINRALDWIEKIMIDLFNMVDQDLNIINIVNKVYIKHHIYESNSILDEEIKMEDPKWEY